MSAVEYVAAAALAWLIGFLPLFEIYIAIPFDLAAGLDPVSATFWAAFGNIVPLWLVDLGYERLRRIDRRDPGQNGALAATRRDAQVRDAHQRVVACQ